MSIAGIRSFRKRTLRTVPGRTAGCLFCLVRLSRIDPYGLLPNGVDLSSGTARAVRCQFDKVRKTPGGSRRTANKMLRILVKSTRFGLVPLVKKISGQEKYCSKPTHFHQTAAKGGGLMEMGSLGAFRRLAC